MCRVCVKSYLFLLFVCLLSSVPWSSAFDIGFHMFNWFELASYVMIEYCITCFLCSLVFLRFSPVQQIYLYSIVFMRFRFMLHRFLTNFIKPIQSNCDCFSTHSSRSVLLICPTMLHRILLYCVLCCHLHCWVSNV